MKRSTLWVLVVLAIMFSASGEPQRLAFVNARVHTMDSENRLAEALLIVGDRIHAVGSRTQIEALLTPATKVIDLGGLSLLPGFIDAHSHFPASGLREVSIDLSPPPIGRTTSIEGLLETIGNAAMNTPPGTWLLGFNYDNTGLADGLHPTRQQLDALTAEHPVFLWHSSGHMGVANSAALSRLNITDTAESFPGGILGRDEQGLLNGLLQEKATPPLWTLLRELPKQQLLRVLTAARDEYLAAGVTTVQNGNAGAGIESVLRWSQRLGLLPQRVVVWPSHDKLSQQLLSGDYSTRSSELLRVGAVKIIADGSPQGLTAYLTSPYLPASGAPSGFAGIVAMPLEQLQAWVLRYHKAGYQLAIHGNGDAAIDDIISAVSAAQHAHPRTDARHILVHAQTLRRDQLPRLQQLGMSPSFFTAHTYYWGDWHRLRSLGPQRAASISPANWADQAGLRYSLHTDSPVTPMLPMQMIWSATRRETLTGHVLGPQQRISRQRALRAITIDAAWQNFLEDSRGSLEAGKLADLVVVSADPLQVDNVRDIQVLRTYIGGKEVFRCNQSACSFVNEPTGRCTCADTTHVGQ
jgi:predicted amidohydrolase YtcJ